MFNINSLLLISITTAFIVLPSLASDNGRERLTPLTSCIGLSLSALQDKSISGNLDDNLKALKLIVSPKGELLVEMMSIDHAGNAHLMELYHEIKDFVGLTLIGSLFSGRLRKLPSIGHENAHFFSPGDLNIISSRHFILKNNILLGVEDGDLIITSPSMSFEGSFLEIAEGQKIIFQPPDDLESCIDYLQYAPRNRLVYMQGTLNFALPSFKDLIITDSDFKISFK